LYTCANIDDEHLSPSHDLNRRLKIEEDVQETKIEFSDVIYAVLEQEQKLDVKVKRTGPIDVDIRFRCLDIARSLVYSCMFYMLQEQFSTHLVN
jgi:hypothetical protein